MNPLNQSSQDTPTEPSQPVSSHSPHHLTGPEPSRNPSHSGLLGYPSDSMSPQDNTHSSSSSIPGLLVPETPLKSPTEDDDEFVYSYFSDRRHEKMNIDFEFASKRSALTEWRMRERLKTVNVSLVLCLNIGVDPPDVVKTTPCAKLECWVDPFSLPGQKALETIGKALQQQYEVWQPRARYRVSLDPSIEETKKLCCNLRRNAKEDRVLFHYNGHGVPKPTPGGELWVFNKNYTQYIPVSIYDIQTWLGSPCIFVYDCSNAGNILVSFDKFAQQRDAEALRSSATPPNPATSNPNGKATDLSSSTSSSPPMVTATPPYVPLKECLQLAACRPNEVLPMSPDLPADLFTCCLTTPIEIALRWFVYDNPLVKSVTYDMVSKVPGRLNDRRTPLGELNWIFTAVTDTIAWNLLPHDLFQKLFRQDLMVAALFRNFLLADRIMRHFNCHPMSTPALPPTAQHAMWDAWDLAVDHVLTQLPRLHEAEKAGKQIEYTHSSFFAHHLSAFEIWLRKGPVSKSPPPQLPIVLQVLLSQVHRLRALMLLSKFLDLGPWAVNAALTVGIHPYVLRLLQSPAAELKPVLVFIWAKIIAVDPSCQNDLAKDSIFTYFISILSTAHNNMPLVSNLSEHRAMCAFILSVFCHNFKVGQQAALKNDLLGALVPHFRDSDPLLRQWVCICLGEFWNDYSEAVFAGVRMGLHEMLGLLLKDPVVEVRSAALFALGCMLSSDSNGNVTAGEKAEEIVALEQTVVTTSLKALLDASPLVREELLPTLSRFVHDYLSKFIHVAFDLIEERKADHGLSKTVDKRTSRISEAGENDVYGSSQNSESSGVLWHKSSLSPTSTHATTGHAIYMTIWKAILSLSTDPCVKVRSKACNIADYVHYAMLASPLVEPTTRDTLLGKLASPESMAASDRLGTSGKTKRLMDKQPSMMNRPTSPFSSMNVSSGPLKRSSSFVNSLKSLVGLGPTDSESPSDLLKNSISSRLDRVTGSGPDSHRQRMRPASMIGLGRSTQGAVTGLAELSRLQQENWNGPLSAPHSVSHDELAYTATVQSNSHTVTGYTSVNHTMSSKDIFIKSSFFDWSCLYFMEAQMRLPEVDDPGSLKGNQRQWRKQRNATVIRETECLYAEASSRRFEESLRSIQLDGLSGNSSLITFHQFEPWVAVANKQQVSLYDWETATSIKNFSNGNPKGSRISAMRFINEEDLTLLLTASDTGMIRLFKNLHSDDDAELVSGWKMLVNSYPGHSSSGVVVSWDQAAGSLIGGGPSPAICVWDAEEELLVQEIATNCSSYVSSLDTGPYSHGNFMAGFGDGNIHCYDRRLPVQSCLVSSFRDGNQPIASVTYLARKEHEFISVSRTGNVLLWDLRQHNSTLHVDTGLGSDMTAFAVHGSAKLIACGNTSSTVRVMNLIGEGLGQIKTHEGFLSRQTYPIQDLAFHPRRLVLGAVVSSSLNLYTSELKYAAPELA